MSVVLGYVAGLTTCPACSHAMSSHTQTAAQLDQDGPDDYDLKLFYSCAEGGETCIFEATPTGITAKVMETIQ
jgi:hypothetical protein